MIGETSARGRGNVASGELIVVHSSDLHLDQPHGREAQGEDLWALRQVLRTAHGVGASLVLLAGDIFDHNRQPLGILDRAARLIGDSSLPVVILPGNHDPLTPDSVYRRGGLADPPNVHVIGVLDDAVVLPDWDLQIWGHAHRDYSDMTPLRDPRPRTTRWQIATAHGHYDAGPYPPERFKGSWLIWDAALAETGADYVALGHWNRAAAVGDGTVPAYYSGSPDLARTVNVVRFTVDGAVTVERAALHGEEAPPH